MTLDIGILGTGAMAAALAERLGSKGHRLVLGSSDPQRAREVADAFGPHAAGGSYREAAERAELLVLATSWEKVEPALRSCAPFDGHILIDCTNPQPAGRLDLAIGHSTSGAEQIADWAPGAKVVKAFNNIYAAALADPSFGSTKATIFYCGDDEAAKHVVHELITSLGFDAVDAGPVTAARYLEPTGALMSHLVRVQGWPAHGVAFGLLRRLPKSGVQP